MCFFLFNCLNFSENSYDFGISNEDGDLILPGSFYSCNGTWVVETSATLFDWQQTYGKVEIWEIDSSNRKYLLYEQEFQWNTSECEWTTSTTSASNTTITTSCDLSQLPLSEYKTENTAKFEFKMEKFTSDNRDSPFIIVWYDLLGGGYSVQPSLTQNRE